MRRKPGSYKHSAGFGLVEVLIAMVLGLLLTIGMTNVFLSSKQAYRTQSALSTVQENGRYAMAVLSRDIRTAGYQGCSSLDVVVPNVIAVDVPGSGEYGAQDAVRGYSYSASKFNSTSGGSASDDYGDTSSTSDDPTGVVAGTDVVTVARADDCGAYLVGNMATDNANIQIGPDITCEFEQDDLVLISDCSSSDLFQITNNPNGGGQITMAHANGSNITNRLSKPYGPDAQIFKFIYSDYYIKLNSFGERALFRRQWVKGAWQEQELVEGVTDLQATYGEDTTADFSADGYFEETAVTDWSNVNSVRLTLTMESKSENVTIEGDRMQQDMATTVGVRNKLQ
ncbi:MAG: hypothetical protein GY792_07345 [Gammaproteobacteria bacterium]|nr:hypothetical protein [Gammaproteobacteria bacterium]